MPMGKLLKRERIWSRPQEVCIILTHQIQLDLAKLLGRCQARMLFHYDKTDVCGG